MAGNPGPLTRNACSHWPAIALAGLFTALGPAPAPGQRAGDVLTVERPGNLLVLNRYQQRLAPGEARFIPPFVPMVIVRERDLLGDGFTPCASVEIDRERFYILRDADGGFSTRGDPGKTEIFRDVTIFGDTVVLLSGRALDLRPAGAKDEIHLKPGARVVREFEHDAQMYVRLTSPAGRFGWITPSRSARSPEWRGAEPAASGGISPADLVSRLQVVVDGANSSLRSVYATLSAEAGKRRVPPSFGLTRAKEGVRCVIKPGNLAGAFIGSMRALLPEFERVLGGTGLHAEMADSAIVIPLR